MQSTVHHTVKHYVFKQKEPLLPAAGADSFTLWLSFISDSFSSLTLDLLVFIKYLFTSSATSDHSCLSLFAIVAVGWATALNLTACFISARIFLWFWSSQWLLLDNGNPYDYWAAFTMCGIKRIVFILTNLKNPC